MLDATIKALAQMFSPPFRAVLWKSVGVALVLIVFIGLALQRLLAWLAGAGAHWAEVGLGSGAHTLLSIATWIVSIAAGLGIIVGSVLLMPAVTALVGSFFVDEIALAVERVHYPTALGTPPPVMQSLVEGIRAALLAVLVYVFAAPFLLFAGAGAVIFFVAAAYLLGREYFELAAMRRLPIAEAKRLRKLHQGTVFIAGLLIAAFVTIPIVNLATPLFAMALMVHVSRMLEFRGQMPNRR